MKKLILLLSLMLLSSLAVAQQVHIGVLSLFHPRELVIGAPIGAGLVVHAGGQSFTLESSSGARNLEIRPATGGGVVALCGSLATRASAVRIGSRADGPVDLLVTVPGKLSRHYQGKLEVAEARGILIPVLTMDRETAVASVVAAESLPADRLEAMKAQAVAARSYFVAGARRHLDYDFCDTTHCQFLRQPPAWDEQAAKAARLTRGLVIGYRSRVVATMYTRSCSGWTQTPADLGLPSDAYPYYSVECRYCRQHPRRWRSRLPAAEAAELHSSDEGSRLAVDRRWGWNRVQSNHFTVQRQATQMIIEGIGQGHGIGLCQAGSRAMAEEGADFRQILAHYYPNTEIIHLD